MTEKASSISTVSEIDRLENKIDILIGLYQKLKEENRMLKGKQDNLIRERAQLIEKSSVARNRVEAMINRLKSMGQGT